MAAVRGLPQRDMVAHFVLMRQTPRGDERVISRIDHQRRNADAMQMGFGRAASPVILRAFEAVQGGSKDVVKLVKVTRRHHGFAVKQAGMLFELQQGFGLH